MGLRHRTTVPAGSVGEWRWFKLSPVVNFSGPETVNALFTAGNIIEDAFEMNYFDAQDRLAVVSVKWREERKSSSIDNRGLFPQIREVLVRRNDTPADAH